MSEATQVSARNRLESILDDNSFVEIGAGVRARATNFNIQEKDTLADGVVTGYGVINGNLVYVYSQDVTVMNGSIGEMHAKKITSLYNLAMKMGAPVIGLIDCAGLRLQEATDALNGFGEIYNKMTLASGVIPQITAVYGNCGGGLAVLTQLSDFTFVEEKGKLFVNTTNALDGTYASKPDTSSAKFQAEAGVADFVGDEETISNGIRQLVSFLPANNEDEAVTDCQDDLNRLCNDLEAEITDSALALSDIADDGLFMEVKSEYAKNMVTGFLKINGTTIGAVANRTVVFDDNGEKAEEFEAVLTVDGANKAEEFVNFCNAFEIPVLTLTNVKGFEATVEAEKHIAKAVAKLTYAFANATVPKVNVIVGEAYGSAYVTMNSKSIGADMTYAWPTASIGMMDASLAAKIMYADEISASEDAAATVSAKAAEYANLQSSVESAAARGYVDTVINPEDTRRYVAAAFEMLYTKREERPIKKNGTV
jgi:acetyl-CoA carboxylase carboxyltransferase component